jgi:pimeloyl-ACP methyl ester carboxylesterase
MPEAVAALESDGWVQVGTEPWLIFEPTGPRSNVGLIVYPGGRVDARSYAPTARAVAEAGHLTVIVPMPLNLAVLAPDRAGEVMAAFPEVDRWAVAGHSLGGAMAANFVRGSPGAADGLVLWAAYPASGDDLSDRDLIAASVYGTRDGVALPEQVLAGRPLLPPDTVWVPIEGGNHAQFGWYGEQGGDNPATISREAQQAGVVAATLAVLEQLEESR